MQVPQPPQAKKKSLQAQKKPCLQPFGILLLKKCTKQDVHIDLLTGRAHLLWFWFGRYFGSNFQIKGTARKPFYRGKKRTYAT